MGPWLNPHLSVADAERPRREEFHDVNLFFLSSQLITYFGGRIYDPNESEAGRLSLTGDYLKGDASLMISDLLLTDSGEYICKVKNGGKYSWNTVNLIVLCEFSARGLTLINRARRPRR